MTFLTTISTLPSATLLVVEFGPFFQFPTEEPIVLKNDLKRQEKQIFHGRRLSPVPALQFSTRELVDIFLQKNLHLPPKDKLFYIYLTKYIIAIAVF